MAGLDSAFALRAVVEGGTTVTEGAGSDATLAECQSASTTAIATGSSQTKGDCRRLISSPPC